MPGKMGELRSGLGLAAGEPDVEQLKVWGELQAGTAVAESSALFPRVELRKEDVARSEQTPAPVAPAEEEPGVALIGFDEFSKLDLRTATVTLAERVAGTDKLMRLELDVGGRPRQIVAGIAQHYEADSLLGKMIVIVANLQPARIRGVESNGMLLAAKDGGKLCLIGVDGEIASGASVG
jgi:methionyl-tRNA synthetase